MMDHMRTLLSYTLATMAGICFIGRLGEHYLDARLCTRFPEKTAYHWRYSAERFHAFRQSGADCHHPEERGKHH